MNEEPPKPGGPQDPLCKINIDIQLFPTDWNGKGSMQ